MKPKPISVRWLTGLLVLLGYWQSVSAQRDIILLVDVSSSMLSQDFAPHRLACIQPMLREAVGACTDCTIGVVAMGKSCQVLAPMTGDKNLVGKAIDQLRYGLFEADGTTVKIAIQTALELLERRDNGAARHIWLIGDGGAEDTTIAPYDGWIQESKVSLTILTLYTAGKVRAPIGQLGGRESNKFVYGTVEQERNETFFKQLAEQVNGRYVWAANAAAANDYIRLLGSGE